MESDIIGFLSSWRELHPEDKTNELDKFYSTTADTNALLEAATTTHSDSDRQNVPLTTYQGVKLYSRYSYLYYYPTMHWNLDQTPETDDYWIGIYRRGAEDSDYITYQWIERIAQGSYKIGKLNTTVGIESRERFEEFELRLFNGSHRRADAVTNILRGTIHDAPTNPDIPETAIRVEPLDSDFIQSIQKFHSLSGDTAHSGNTSSWKDLRKRWHNFTLVERRMLLPVLEQESLPDSIKKPEEKASNRPEPKLYFPKLGQVEPLRRTDDAKAPRTIVLSITLDSCATYIYPTIGVETAVPVKRAWVGLYRTKSNVCFDPKAYIGKEWQWVGPGQENSKTNLAGVKEETTTKGSTKQQYLGVIFKGTSPDEQMGFASNTIVAAITTTPAAPPPAFDPDFDKVNALHYARLSSLAYDQYSTVENKLQSMGYTPEMQIYDSKFDTNGFIASNSTSVVVAFRGTNIKSTLNIFTDAWFFRKEIIAGEATLGHGGFIDAYNTVGQAVMSKLDMILGSKALFITGHSLGGALAALLMYHVLKKNPSSQPTMYVYGCPPVGDDNFAKFFEGKASNTITIEDDPVSSGKLILLGDWAGLYKPVLVKFLPKAASHSIDYYIQQLENLK